MTGKCSTNKISLFGPVDSRGMLRGIYAGDDWKWPGSCITAHTANFQFNHPHKSLAHAVFRVTWSLVSPGGTYNTGRALHRLVSMDDGPSNLVTMATIDSDSMDPVVFKRDMYRQNSAVDITATMNGLVAGMAPKTLAWQVKGDNTNFIEVFSVSLELSWRDD